MGKIIKNGSLDYVKYCGALHALCDEYAFLKLASIGKSVEGREIFSLTVGDAAETVLFAAAFHGSEHITTEISLMFTEMLCLCLLTDSPLAGINLKKAIRGRSITVIPRVNPDGCDISVRGAAAAKNYAFIRRISEGDTLHYNANAHGVDINHNFPAGWDELHRLERMNGILGPSPTRYGGKFPESEPETRALCEFCRKNPVRHALALHTQGEVIYWNYGDRTPEKAFKMAQIMASVSGYAPDVPVALATGGGFKDFFIEEFARPAFTLEMGMGKNPLPENTAEDIYRKAEEMLTLAAIM